MDRKKELSKEYLEHIANMEKHEKERYLLEFEKFPVGKCFRKVKSELSTDYEFVEDNNPIEKYYLYNNSNRNSINPLSLYFRKISNTQCEEVLTHTLFERTEENVFYNDETGLKFDFARSFEKAVGMELDWVYVDNTYEYLNHYKELQEKDNEIRSKGQKVLLKKGIKFTK